jgi:hypothetical protein
MTVYTYKHSPVEGDFRQEFGLIAWIDVDYISVAVITYNSRVEGEIQESSIPLFKISDTYKWLQEPCKSLASERGYPEFLDPYRQIHINGILYDIRGKWRFNWTENMPINDEECWFGSILDYRVQYGDNLTPRTETGKRVLKELLGMKSRFVETFVGKQDSIRNAMANNFSYPAMCVYVKNPHCNFDDLDIAMINPYGLFITNKDVKELPASEMENLRLEHEFHSENSLDIEFKDIIEVPIEFKIGSKNVDFEIPFKIETDSGYPIKKQYVTDKTGKAVVKVNVNGLEKGDIVGIKPSLGVISNTGKVKVRLV